MTRAQELALGRSHPLASVVIPAHNEAANIQRTLATLTADSSPGEFEVIVVCNGCADNTADLAREVEGVTVVEIPAASKLAALREGDQRASTFPRLYLDADVGLSTAAARALPEGICREGALVGGLRGKMDLGSSPALVRLFYEFRERLPVFTQGLIGAGVYCLSAAGHDRIGEWPNLRSGDDQFVLRSFAPDERFVLRGHHSRVNPPSTLRDLIRRGVRTRRGNARLTAGAAGPPLVAPSAGFLEALRLSARRPRGLLSAAVFVVLTAFIRLRAATWRGGDDWITPVPGGPRASADAEAVTERSLSGTGSSGSGEVRPVAIITVTYNAERVLPQFLSSVPASRSGGTPLVIAVDNGSVDGSLEILRSVGELECIVVESHNTGFAHGINTALEHVPSGYDVLICNPDVRLAPGCIDRLGEVLAENPAAAVVTPLLVDENGSPLPSARRRPTPWRTAVEALVGGSRAGPLGEAAVPDPSAGRRYVDWATGAVLLLRRSVVDRLGGFDESFFLYSEETEYCLRVRSAGYRVVLEPAAVAIHEGGQLHEDQTLWALRAVNRVRRHKAQANRVSSFAFRAASAAFELRRVATGQSTSRLAFRALLARDLDRKAIELVRDLGGDPSPMISGRRLDAGSGEGFRPASR
jgi:N-acetylglucosaminyl-diphospho-decaprenol L-rhamnosyltransferase